MSNKESLTKEELKTKVDYIFSNSFNHTQHAYIDITGDLIAGTLLSQIIYWFSLDKNKKSKIRIFKDGNYWLAKGREDWFEEIRISPKQYDTAIKKLKSKGLVETRLYKFKAVPTTHIRPIFTEINKRIDEWKKKVELEITNGIDTNITISGNSVLTNGENGNLQSVNMEICELVNSLTENTNKDYIDKDYTQETTGNSFSKEKERERNSPKGEKRNSDFSKRKVQSRAKKDLRDYSAKDFEEAESRLPVRARDITYDWTEDKTLSDNVYDFFKYFLDEHRKHTGYYHYPLTDGVLRKVLIAVTESISIDRKDGYTDTYRILVNNEDDDWKIIVDKYFDTDFSQECDYSLVHFSSETVLTNIMNHAGKYEWCESEAW